MDVNLLRYENRSELASVIRSLRNQVHPCGFERYDCRGVLTAPSEAYANNRAYPTIAERVRFHFEEPEEQRYITSRPFQDRMPPARVPENGMTAVNIPIQHTGKFCATIDFVINNYFFSPKRAEQEFERVLQHIANGYRGSFTLTVGYARPGIVKSEDDIDTFMMKSRPYIVFTFDHQKNEISLDTVNPDPGKRLSSEMHVA